jgi:GTP-binding protein HflX
MVEIAVGLERLRHEAERAVIVGLQHLEGEGARSMQEMADLAIAAGCEPVGFFVQSRKNADRRTYIGKGKVEELKAEALSLGADVILFDGDLSPAQVRNLVDQFDCKILDRTELILDIFSQHAKTSEGKLQVELAQLSYLLPRLTGRGKMMDRIGGGGGGTGGGAGGVGVRGPGETKLETDRRRLRQRITVLRERLQEVRERREIERQSRRKSGLPTVSLVGYTNAGKSTLLNALAGSVEVSVNDRLFETLDPTVRKIDLGKGNEILVSDTVGFIHDLPHHLVTAFRATLEEVIDADFLLHVCDASDTHVRREVSSTDEVLYDLGVPEKQTLILLNKWDWVTDPERQADLLSEFRGALPISALTGDGLDALREYLMAHLFARLIPLTLQLPYSKLGLLQKCRERGHVHEEEYVADGVVVDVEVEEALVALLRDYVVAEE